MTVDQLWLAGCTKLFLLQTTSQRVLVVQHHDNLPTATGQWPFFDLVAVLSVTCTLTHVYGLYPIHQDFSRDNLVLGCWTIFWTMTVTCQPNLVICLLSDLINIYNGHRLLICMPTVTLCEIWKLAINLLRGLGYWHCICEVRKLANNPLWLAGYCHGSNNLPRLVGCLHTKLDGLPKGWKVAIHCGGVQEGFMRQVLKICKECPINQMCFELPI